MTFAADYRLHTDRLALRRVVPTDRQDLMALEGDPEVMRFLNGGCTVPEEGLPHADFLTPRGTETEVLVARIRPSGRFVGWFALFDDGLIGGVRTAELGYRLRRQAWGQGYASEGAMALVREAFDVMGFGCVRAQTLAVNLGSRRVLEKAGFQCVEHTFPNLMELIPGGEHGEVIYEVRRGIPSTTP